MPNSTQEILIKDGEVYTSDVGHPISGPAVFAVGKDIVMDNCYNIGKVQHLSKDPDGTIKVVSVKGEFTFTQ